MSAALKSQSSETFTMQLTAAASLEEIERWFAAARPGERAIYASGFTLPREAESVKRVGQWIEQGKVHPVQQRDPHDSRRWQWLVVKAGAVSGVTRRDAGRSRGRQSGANELAREQMRHLMKVLRACAAGRRRARYIVERLEAERQIAVEPGDQVNPPVVTILKPGRARGKATARVREIQS
jgi:hypothetical protein